MGATLQVQLAIDALSMALQRRQPAPGLMHHSDRGVQYACGAYQEILATEKITCSMSRRGDCWDNAVAESFFATLEWELLEREDWHTHAEARRALFEYLEIWYNRQRRHSSLGYRSPAEYEAYLVQVRPAA
jgi:putative transposase